MANLTTWQEIIDYSPWKSKTTIIKKIKTMGYPVDRSSGRPISSTESIDRFFERRSMLKSRKKADKVLLERLERMRKKRKDPNPSP